MTKTLKHNANKIQRDANSNIIRDAKGNITPEFTFMAESKVNVSFTGERPTIMIMEQNGKTIRCRPAKYAYYFGGKEPSEKTLMNWENEGYCKTVTGYRTEPDGYGPDGSPSWMLALGYI